MIVVRVELWSAIDGTKTELARMVMSNDGTSQSPSVGHYDGWTLRGRATAALNAAMKLWHACPLRQSGVTRTGRIDGYRKNDLHVWHLVGRMLQTMGYGI